MQKNKTDFSIFYIKKLICDSINILSILLNYYVCEMLKNYRIKNFLFEWFYNYLNQLSWMLDSD